MSSKKQKLEFTWIGKENRPNLEPRILLEEPMALETGGFTDYFFVEVSKLLKFVK